MFFDFHASAQSKITLWIPGEIRLSEYKISQLLLESSSLTYTISSQMASQDRDDHDYGLWILKDKKIWRWNFVQNSLNSFDIGISPRFVEEKSSFDRKTIFLINHKKKLVFCLDNFFYLFDTDDRKLFFLPFVQKKFGNVLDLVTQDTNLSILTQKGFFQFDPNQRKISDYIPYDFELYKKGGFFLDHETFIVNFDQFIGIIEINKEKKIKKIYKSKSTILGTKKINDNQIILATSETIVRIDRNGRILQMIPIERGRKLSQFQVSSMQHAFLFSDGLLEIYDIETKKVSRWVLPISPDNQIIRFDIDGPYFVVQYAKSIRVFNSNDKTEFFLE